MTVRVHGDSWGVVVPHPAPLTPPGDLGHMARSRDTWPVEPGNAAACTLPHPARLWISIDTSPRWLRGKGQKKNENPKKTPQKEKQAIKSQKSKK